MDGLAEFEKELAQEKEERRELERKERKHRHHRHHESRHDRERASGRDRHRERDRNRDSDGNRNRESHREQIGDNKEDDSRYKHDSHRHSSTRERESELDGSDHRRKRTRHTRSEDDPDSGMATAEGDNIGRSRRDPEVADSESASAPGKALARDSWMTAPSGVGIDYVHRQNKQKPPPSKETSRHQISNRELNSDALQHLNDGKALDELNQHAPAAPTYTFGDEGSQWRLTKLKGVYAIAEQSDRPVEDVATERFGTLQAFDEAREERSEMERRRLYGKGYAVKEKPTGDMYRERMERIGGENTNQSFGEMSSDDDGDDEAAATLTQRTVVPVDQTTLNRLRAQLMKAKLRKVPDVGRLEKEYNDAMAVFSSGTNINSTEQAVVLDASHSRLLAGIRGEVKAIETRRGKERGLVQANDDMTIEDMVREERRTRGVAGGEGRRLAERIAKDGKFVADLDYLDENAEKLAKHVHKSEANLKNIAINEFSKINKILESCPLCHHEDRRPPLDLPLAPMVSLATRVYLTLPTEPELTGAEGGAVIVPVDHHTNLLECNDDEWEEIRNFMKSLTRLYHDQGRDVIFYENAATPQRRMHAALVAVPIPYEMGDTAPAFFREAILSADEEWSQHKKIIDTGKRAREGLGKMAFRKSLAKQMPYFHAWFTLDGGLGHIVEDSERWPKGDLFAREIVGGMLDVDASIIKRQGRWTRADPRLDDFKKRWRKFDWTRVFEETA
ncbi:cell cycle control protein cwf19 [Ophiostoma piceae UAMH 11346]|uniref:Cell cycle control protein cwf19 n=1 Tax=Ophiostoma piceae (strain UAMH 11346) TaxID=1262450 RepID=S3CT03_OPHP1|nr:cell cycle control protein cwf19 [Ophiostoma piceae UAMH 11346]